MFARISIPAVILSAFAAGGCTVEVTTDDPDAIDTTLLTTYRDAIPSMDRLAAVEPGDPTRAGDAVLPTFAVTVAGGVNDAVGAVLENLRSLVDEEPAKYDEAQRRFLWGPYENDDGYGQLGAFIGEQEPGAPFEYIFSLFRYDESDQGIEITPIIIGQATPDDDDDDRSAGAILWDFEANYGFEVDYGDAAAAESLDRGRFAVVYGSFPRGDYHVSFAYAVAGAGYRNMDADLLYGVISNDENRLGFLDWQAVGDFCGTDTGGSIVCFADYRNDATATDAGDELMNARLAFANEGRGRGYMQVWDGDIEDPATVEDDLVLGEECWDDSISTLWLALDGVDMTASTSADCQEPFVTLIGEDDLPTLDDVDPADRDKIYCIIDHGPDAPECD